MTVRLIYASKSCVEISKNDIDQILSTAKSRNQELLIGGVLYFSCDWFLQALEGSRESVNDLYSKILRDRRHTNAVIIKYDYIQRRNFGTWSMGYIPKTEFTNSILEKYNQAEVFTPLTIDVDEVENLLLELSQAIPRI